MYTINDIKIFITTHNRSDLISQTIESFLNQSIKPNEITILDNESSDNTQEVVETYSAKGVKYVKTYGFLGNFKKAHELADKKYVMLFHDDDILHPDYFKLALEILNKEKNVVELVTRYTEFNDKDIPTNFKKLNKKYHCFDFQKDFVEHMFFLENISYATAIYRTDIFQKIDLEYEKFNKFNDWAFMAKFGEYGKIILLEDKNIYFVRRHEGQDTWTNTNVPSIEQIINWDKFFYDIMFENDNDNLRKIYENKSTYFLKGKYNAFLAPEDRKNITLEDLYKKAVDMGLKIKNKDDENNHDLIHLFYKYLKLKSLKNVSIWFKIKRFKYFMKLKYKFNWSKNI